MILTWNQSKNGQNKCDSAPLTLLGERGGGARQKVPALSLNVNDFFLT